MDKKLYPRIGEEVIHVTLDNGLPVCIVPKKGFSRKYALFAPATAAWICAFS